MMGEAAALGASMCWAVGSHLFGRVGRQHEVPPGAMNLGKCLTATVLFGASLFALTGTLWPTASRGDVGMLLASGLVGLAFGDTCYFGAMASLGVRRALLLLSTAPVFTAVGGALFLGEPIRALDAASIAAVMLGVAIVIHEQVKPVEKRTASATASGPLPMRGLLLGLGAGLGQAGGSLMARHPLERMSSLDAAIVRIVAGLVGLSILAAATGRLFVWVRALSKGRAMRAVASSAMVGTYMGVWLAQFAIGHAASTAIATTLLAMPPIFALPLGRWLNDEPITARALGGSVLACAGCAGLAYFSGLAR